MILINPTDQIRWNPFSGLVIIVVKKKHPDMEPVVWSYTKFSKHLECLPRMC